MNKQGLLLCAKYSAAPNFFGYCGPDKNASLVDHLYEHIADREVEVILSEFDTLYLNLSLIASENNITDVFDDKVVEAYWIGNNYLKHISVNNYVSLLKEKFRLPYKIGEGKFTGIKRKMYSYKLYPHHAFHVFNIFKRTGNDPSFHTLHTMDECRIGWGQVTQAINKFEYSVRTVPLALEQGKLKFGEPADRNIHTDYRGKKIPVNLKIGDWVSFHWGRYCDTLRESQVRNLSHYTRQAVAYFNAPEL